MQGDLFDHHLRPDPLEELVLRDQVASLLNHHDQKVECAWTQRDQNLVLQQSTFVDLQLERTE